MRKLNFGALNDDIIKSLNPAMLKMNNKLYAHSFNRGFSFLYFSS